MFSDHRTHILGSPACLRSFLSKLASPVKSAGRTATSALWRNHCSVWARQEAQGWSPNLPRSQASVSGTQIWDKVILFNVCWNMDRGNTFLPCMNIQNLISQSAERMTVKHRKAKRGEPLSLEGGLSRSEVSSLVPGPQRPRATLSLYSPLSKQKIIALNLPFAYSILRLFFFFLLLRTYRTL